MHTTHTDTSLSKRKVHASLSSYNLTLPCQLFNSLIYSLHTNQRDQEKKPAAMKDKGKAVAVSTSSSSRNWFSDYSSSSSDLPCRKHPSSSSVGICAYCLKDRLVKLVCSDCGEQRLSSCSCSDISSSHPNSSCVVDIGSVGRISFLIENDNKDGDDHDASSIKSRSASTLLLKRSSSTATTTNSHVEIKKHGFWKFGKLFKKKRDGGVDEKSEIWDVENRGVSRSRSVCGFRSGFDDDRSSFSISTGRPSDLNKEREKNCVEFDGSFSTNGGEDSAGFIDLKLSLSSESKPEFSCLKDDEGFGVRVSRDGTGDQFFSGLQSQSFDYLRGDSSERMFSNGSSCRITVNNSEMKKCRKSFKVWKWIVKHHSWKKDDHEHDSKY